MEASLKSSNSEPYPIRAGEPRLLELDSRGLYCEAGGLHVDPWLPVENAFITHAHGDHARTGSKAYYCAAPCAGILQHRMGKDAKIIPVPYGEQRQFGRAKVSFHPAGHILGSAQIRIEADGCVWVVSGDYKRDFDPTCASFEVVPCDVFITEATFALPIYEWQSGAETARQVLRWWDDNIREQRPSILFVYALGKAQRVLAELKALDPSRHVYTHGAVEALTKIYRNQGVDMLPTTMPTDEAKSKSFNGELILAPPSGFRSTWMKRFKGAETGFASGWMRVRGNRRRKGYDRGFILSDHADWSGLVSTARDSQAKLILPTHGGVDVLTRYLRDEGFRAEPLKAPAYNDQLETPAASED